MSPVRDLALSRRMERTEGSAASRFVEARKRSEPEARAEWREVAGAYLLYDGPRSPMTQTFAPGLESLPSDAEVKELAEFFESRGAPGCWVC